MLLLTTGIREQAGNLILTVILQQSFLFTVCIVCICMCAHTHTHTQGIWNIKLQPCPGPAGHGDSFCLNTTVPNSVSHPPRAPEAWQDLKKYENSGFKLGGCCLHSHHMPLISTSPFVEGNPPLGLLEDQQSLYWAEAPPPRFSIPHTLSPSHALFSSTS